MPRANVDERIPMHLLRRTARQCCGNYQNLGLRRCVFDDPCRQTAIMQPLHQCIRQLGCLVGYLERRPGQRFVFDRIAVDTRQHSGFDGVQRRCVVRSVVG